MSISHSVASCGAIRIVLVEDELAFRESLAEMLRDDGHEVLAYADPARMPPFETLGRVDLLLTDYEMPGKNGLALADEFHAHRPGVPVLLATAYRAGVDGSAATRPFLRVVQKPITYDGMHRLIHECAARSSVAS